MKGRALPVVGAMDRHHFTKGLVRLTMACNERCPFCNVPVENYPEPTPSDAEVQAQLDAFVASGERTLTLSGGEPTLRRRQLLSVIEQARARGVPFAELQTNAILIDERYATALAEAGLTSAFVSLLSDEAALHDELAGLRGAFPLCLRGIDALLDAGIAVTLNPVIARQTQARVAAYIDFVARRLPRVTAISLSAVQPHGRAAQHPELLPDYGVLGPEVLRAQARAELHSIPLLNPYCGLPLCVGWSERRATSVEAREAELAWRQPAASPYGLDNRGNKRHGTPCRPCALRTRCGGAWHAYWDTRDGKGIEAPLRSREPWWPEANEQPGQTVVQHQNDTGLDEAVLSALAAASTPTVWLLAERLAHGDAAHLIGSGCTDVALLLDAHTLLEDAPLATELTALAEHNRGRDGQLRLRVTLGLRKLGSFERGFEAMRRAAALGVDAVRLLMVTDARHQRFMTAVRQALPALDVTAGQRAA